jgi:hypothetical protein
MCLPSCLQGEFFFNPSTTTFLRKNSLREFEIVSLQRAPNLFRYRDIYEVIFSLGAMFSKYIFDLLHGDPLYKTNALEMLLRLEEYFLINFQQFLVLNILHLADQCYNSLVLLTFVSRSSCRFTEDGSWT